ncbi:MAG: APC family permease [Neomegalonema sp.]|nr:APC family permease [Neomegalonema sp.]
MTAQAGKDDRLARRLGIGLLTFYGVGVMVGAGIYVLVGEVAGLAGDDAPWAFLLAGLAAALTAASYAELSARIPEAGGEAAYALAAYRSQMLSVCVGFGVAAVGLLSAGAVLQGGIGYLRALVPLPVPLLVLVVGGILTLAAIWGVVESMRFAAVLTVIEVLGLLVILAVAFWAEPRVLAIPAAPTPQAEALPWSGLAAAVFLAFFAFIGFEDMVNMAEETREPARAMPIAIALAFVIVLSLYILVTIACLRMVAPHELAASDRPLALVFERATGSEANFIAAIGVSAALNGVLAQIVMAARVLYGLGRRVPSLAWAHKISPRFRTPMRASVICGAIVIAMALFLPLSALASATSFILILVFIVMNGALLVFKRRTKPPQGAPDLPIFIPVLGIVASGAVLIGALV